MSAKKLYSRKDAIRLTGLSGGTLYRYAAEEKIKTRKTPGGHLLYDISTLVAERDSDSDEGEKVSICYCRVSTHGQKDDLTRQITYMSEKYPEHLIISDVGSGINFKRKGLRKVIDIALSGNLEELVVSYKDRLCRIGYELIEYILTEYSGTKIIVDSHKKETIEEEIANDILQIINVYSAKINGMRSYKSKNDTK